jgi:predicted acetyltransferase
MADLIAPTARLHAAWLESRDDWGKGVYQDGAGFELLRPGEELDSPGGFAAWVSRLSRAADPDGDPSRDPESGRVLCTYRWMVEDEKVLGAVALRHRLNDELLKRGGNIGFGVRPSARGRGLATWALGEILGEARAIGLDRVLITCSPANAASARTIEHLGGVLEEVRGDISRYWIELQ